MFFRSLIHSFSQYLLSIYSGPETVLGASHTMVGKLDMVSHRAYSTVIIS